MSRQYQYIDFSYVDSECGSGKTYRLSQWFDEIENPTQNHIYVCPRLDLMDNFAKDVHPEEYGFKVEYFRSKTREGKDVPQITKAAKGFINGTRGNMSQVVVITHATFRLIADDIARPDEWLVFVDESMTSYEHSFFDVKGDDTSLLDHFYDMLEVDEETKQIVGYDEFLEELADSSSNIDSTYKNWHLQKLAEDIISPVMHSVVVKKDARRLDVISYMSPDIFRGFKEIIFLTSHFTHTVFYHIWTKIFRESFVKHKVINAWMLTIGKFMGPFVRVGYLLNTGKGNDTWSASRNSLDAVVGEDGTTVFDECVKTVRDYCAGSDLLIAASNQNRKDSSKRVLFGDVDLISIGVGGSNEYADFDSVAVLATSNPQPPVSKWLKGALGMSNEQVMFAHQVHNDVQVAGRIVRSLQHAQTKTMLVLGKASADFLRSIYVGATDLGKVGDVPDKPRKERRAMSTKDQQFMNRVKKLTSFKPKQLARIFSVFSKHPHLQTDRYLDLYNSVTP